MKNIKTTFIRSKFSPVNKNLLRPNSNSNFSDKKMRHVNNSDKKEFRYSEHTSKTQDNIREYEAYNSSNYMYSNNPSSGNKKSTQMTSQNSNVAFNNMNINAINNHHNFETSDLVFNINDDFKTVINKNNKLRNLLVQASNKINEMSTKAKEREEEYRIEKAGILDELEKITDNYKIYAEGYKNYSVIDEQLKNLQHDYNHNYKVLTSYQESINSFLKDYMNLYKSISVFLSTKYTKNPLQFLFEIKENILENLGKYKGTIDNLNFRDIFDEYTEIISNTNKQQAPPSHSPKVKFNDQPKIIQTQPHVTKKSLSHREDISPNSSFINTVKPPLKEKDPYNYPFQPSKNKSASITQTNKTSTLNVPAIKSNLKQNASSKHSRQASVDTAVDKKTKSIEYMESHIKNYFDQLNTKNELKDLTESINSNFDKINNNLFISKESLNTSNVSNVFEKNSQLRSHRDNKKENSQVNHQYYDPNGLLEQTPQFMEEKGIIHGYVIEDFEKTREGEMSCRKGDRVEIISINRTKGYLYVDIDGEKGLIPENYVQWDEY